MMKRKTKNILYNLVQWTWGLPQTLAGAGLYLKHRRDPHFNYNGARVTAWNSLRGVSLGKFIFVPEKKGWSTTQNAETAARQAVQKTMQITETAPQHAAHSTIRNAETADQQASHSTIRNAKSTAQPAVQSTIRNAETTDQHTAHSTERKAGEESVSRFLLEHEYGHTIQSLILGPMYLLLVGLPSLLWNRLPYFERHRKKSGRSYYSAVFERTANSLGEKAAKKPGQR